MPRLFLAAALFATITGTGCKSDNPASCELEANKDNKECKIDGGGPIDTRCTVDKDCASTPVTAICDTVQRKCVQCTANKDTCDKLGTAPVCDVTAEACVACTTDNDCSAGAGACLPTGACAAPAAVIHVASSNNDPKASCGGGAPQKACSFDDALDIAAADPTKQVIRFDDNGTYTATKDHNFVVNANVIIEAGTATLHHKNGAMGDGPLLKISNSKSVTLIGGNIEGAFGNGGDGVQCDSGTTLSIQNTVIQGNNESAIDSSCTLTVTSATLRDNSKNSRNFPNLNIAAGTATISRSLLANAGGGGIAVASGITFQIVGNFIINNGDVNGTLAGIILSGPAPTSHFDFNTIAGNKSQIGLTAGVQCFGNTFTAKNNIIWNNSGGNALGGNCVHAYSVIGPDAGFPSGIDDGNHNTGSDPKLISDTDNPHLQAGSSAHRHADAAADLTGIASKDIDGDMRTSPADSGADYVP